MESVQLKTLTLRKFQANQIISITLFIWANKKYPVFLSENNLFAMFTLRLIIRYGSLNATFAWISRWIFNLLSLNLLCWNMNYTYHSQFGYSEHSPDSIYIVWTLLDLYNHSQSKEYILSGRRFVRKIQVDTESIARSLVCSLQSQDHIGCSCLQTTGNLLHKHLRQNTYIIRNWLRIPKATVQRRL